MTIAEEVEQRAQEASSRHKNLLRLVRNEFIRFFSERELDELNMVPSWDDDECVIIVHFNDMEVTVQPEWTKDITGKITAIEGWEHLKRNKMREHVPPDKIRDVVLNTFAIEQLRKHEGNK